MGCRFHEFPYTAKGLIARNGRYPKHTFKDENDVWKYIWELDREASNQSQEGNTDTVFDIYQQLPFFCCPNVILDKECQKMISRYIYCKETGTPPYDGEYGSQPYMWIENYFAISGAFQAKNKHNQMKNKS